MKINYDFKFSGLLVEVDDDQYDQMTSALLNDPEGNDFADYEVNFIQYSRYKNEKEISTKTPILIFCSYIIFTILGVILIVLGFSKLLEIIFNFIGT